MLICQTENEEIKMWLLKLFCSSGKLVMYCVAYQNVQK